MGKIRQLDQQIANQIAAGEVVERPLSVVKELLENALDAQAKNIEIHLRDGGLGYIIIQDDGEGMDAEDAELAFSRYATSKLSLVTDLERISTFGFRGEALPSIASIAKVKLQSRRQDAPYGTEVVVLGGQISSVGKASAQCGTRIEVRELFYNVPARKKFMKTMHAEAAAIERLVRAFSIFHQGVSFRLQSDEKVLCHQKQLAREEQWGALPGMKRAVDVLGKDAHDLLYFIDERSSLLRLSGYVAAPMVHRRDTRGITIFVNGRFVEDKKLVGAIKASYRTLLEVGRQPVCALFIEVNPKELDVNVHPRKMEVRFSDERQVQSHMIRALSQFLAKTPWLLSTKTHAFESTLGQATSLEHARESSPSPLRMSARGSSFDALLGSVPYFQPGSSSSMSQTPFLNTHAGFGNRSGFSQLRAIGQVAHTYLLLEAPSALVVIDQHAAHERVMFEKIRAEWKDRQALLGEPLLFPLRVELDAREMASLEENHATLMSYGIDAEPFSDHMALVRQLPRCMSEKNGQALLKDVLAELSEQARSDLATDLFDHLCATLACHGSVRAGQKLSSEEISALLQELDQIELGAHCPHGRPVVRTIYVDEMKKWFDRH